MLIHIPQYPQFAASKNMAEFDIYHMTIYDMIIYWRFVKEKTMIWRNGKHGQMHLLTKELLVEQVLLNADAFTTKSYLDFLQS